MPRRVVPMASPPTCTGVQQPVFLEMPGENHVGPVAEHQVLADVHAAGRQRLDFGEQAGRVEHHAAEAITHCTCGRKMPLGTSDSLKVCPPGTTVCPALAPP